MTLRYFPNAPIEKDYVVLPDSLAEDMEALASDQRKHAFCSNAPKATFDKRQPIKTSLTTGRTIPLRPPPDWVADSNPAESRKFQITLRAISGSLGLSSQKAVL